MIWLSIVGTIAAVLSGVTASLGELNRRKIREVHVLVNDRLDKALERIANLQNDLRDATNGVSEK